MKRPTALLLLCLSALQAAPSATAQGDTRQRVELPPPMAQHMLGNMRDHLKALAEIQQSLGGADFVQAAKVAEQRLGLSSLEAHGAAHMAPFMPEPMQEMGTQMHRSASRLALAAQESSADGNLARTLTALAELTQRCVQCHAAYRIH